MLDLAATDQAAQLILRYLQTAGRFDLVFSINYGGEFRDALGRGIADLAGGPHVIWHTDYVLSQAERLKGTPGSTAVLLVDPTQVDAVRSIYGENRFQHLAYFPHPAVGSPAPDDTSVASFVAKRPIRVLWAGGFQAPQNLWAEQATPAARVMQDAVDLALSVEWMPPHQALDQVLTARGLDIRDPQFIGARESANLIDLEVRRTRRFQFTEAIARSGLPVWIYGADWHDQLSRFKNVAYGGEVEMPRLLELMASARLVLNTNGNFGAGSHERPFSASLAGAATFSDFSHYYGQVFSPGRNIELFRWKRLDDGIEALVSLAADEERCFSYAASAKALTAASHTWDRRLDQIFAAADAVRQH
jgi:hypothetical protein